MKSAYEILLSKAAFERLSNFHWEVGITYPPGKYLGRSLASSKVQEIADVEFLSLLLKTKRPRIFAESEVKGDGTDWTLKELRLLGDISIAVPVTVYDNGLHENPLVYEKPISATLIYAVGALLQNGRGLEPADWAEVVRDGNVDSEGHYRLFKRRLLPVLQYVNGQAGDRGRKAFLTLTAMGCGHFAGPFRGTLGEVLKNTLIRLLDSHCWELPHLKAVYFDTYRECQNERHQLGGISFLVRPLTQGNENKPQLCPPTHFEEAGDDFSDCDLFSIVSWDHVSWPGNDFYAGWRATDDGVKAAATDSMWKITGVEGEYDSAVTKYQPPAPYDTWEEVVQKNNLKINIGSNLKIYHSKG